MAMTVRGWEEIDEATLGLSTRGAIIISSRTIRAWIPRLHES